MALALRFRAKSNMSFSEAERRRAALTAAQPAPSPLPPSMIAERLAPAAEAGPESDHQALVRALNGAIDQDEIPQGRSGTAREAPSTGMRDGTATEAVQTPPETSVGIQSAAPLQKAGVASDDDAGRPTTPPRNIEQWHPDGAGLVRVRPLYERIEVVELAADERLLILPTGFKVKVDAECSAFLAWRLMPQEWRTYLAGRIGEGT